jgi:spore coat protein H
MVLRLVGLGFGLEEPTSRGLRPLLATLAVSMVLGCSQGENAGNSPALSWSDVDTGGPEDSGSDGGLSDATLVDTTGKPGTGPENAYGLSVMKISGSANDLSRIHERFEEEITTSVDVTWNGLTWSGVKMELHGGFARTVPKKSYRLVFPDANELRGDLFGTGEDQDYRRLVLQASWIDRTFIRNKLTMDLLRDLDGLAPRIGYVILEMNGQWLGLYQTIERIDRPYLERHKLDKDGNLYKAESHWANWQAKDDPLAGYDVQEGKENSHDDLGELLDALSFTPALVEEFEDEVAPRLELEDFMTWQMVHTLAMNADTFTKNYYLHHDIDAEPGTQKAKFRLISWDADATWGNSWDGTTLPSDLDSWHGSDAFSPRLFSVPEYKSTYLQSYLDALGDSLSAGIIGLRVSAIESLIEQAAQADLIHWKREGTFADEMARLRTSIDARVGVMTQALQVERQ